VSYNGHNLYDNWHLLSQPPPLRVIMSAGYSDEQLEGIEPLRTVRTNELLQERLIEYIRRRGLVAGDRLPSQQVLARRFDVSLVALREALRALEALGILEVRGGAGWFVKPFSFDPIAKGLLYHTEFNEDTLRDLHEIRMSLETSFAIHATHTLAKEDIEELQALADAMVANAQVGLQWHELDHRFHQKMFSTIRNQVFNKLMDVFWALYGYLGLDVDSTESLSEAWKHRLIVDALRTGDPALVTARLEDSLKGSTRRMSK